MLYLKPVIIITLSWFPQNYTEESRGFDSQHIMKPCYKQDSMIYSTQDYIENNHNKLLEILINEEYENDAR